MDVVRITVLVIPCFQSIADFGFHGFRENILLIKKHLQLALYLAERPRATLERRERRDQHIRVMPDLVKVKMIFVVIVRRFVIVQLALQLRFHRAVLRFGGKHIAVLAGVGRNAERRHAALDQHRAGRSDIQKKYRDEQNRQRNQKALLVFRDPLRRFFRVLCGTLGCFRGNFGCRHRAAACFCSGILLFDGAFLLPAGIRIALQLRVLLLRLLLQRVEVGAVGARFGTVCVAVRLELMGPMCGFCDTDSLLGSFFQLMCALYADVIILAFPDFPVRRRTDNRAGGIPNGVLQLGFWARLFCAVFCWDFCFCLLQLLNTFCRFFRCLGNFRGGEFFISKLQPWGASAHALSPPGQYGMPRKSSTAPQPSLWIQNSYCFGCVSAMR